MVKLIFKIDGTGLEKNPHWMRVLNTQYIEQVNVWAGIVGCHVIGTFLIVGNFNGDKYLALLQNNVTPAFANLYPARENRKIPGNVI